MTSVVTEMERRNIEMLPPSSVAFTLSSPDESKNIISSSSIMNFTALHTLATLKGIGIPLEDNKFSGKAEFKVTDKFMCWFR